jgi:hypothetical protein
MFLPCRSGVLVILTLPYCRRGQVVSQTVRRNHHICGPWLVKSHEIPGCKWFRCIVALQSLWITNSRVCYGAAGAPEQLPCAGSHDPKQGIPEVYGRKCSFQLIYLCLSQHRWLRHNKEVQSNAQCRCWEEKVTATSVQKLGRVTMSPGAWKLLPQRPVQTTPPLAPRTHYFGRSMAKELDADDGKTPEAPLPFPGWSSNYGSTSLERRFTFLPPQTEQARISVHCSHAPTIISHSEHAGPRSLRTLASSSQVSLGLHRFQHGRFLHSRE